MVISMFGCFGLPVGNRLLTMHQRARLLRFLLNEHMRCSVLVVLLETTALEARAVRSRCPSYNHYTPTGTIPGRSRGSPYRETYGGRRRNIASGLDETNRTGLPADPHAIPLVRSGHASQVAPSDAVLPVLARVVLLHIVVVLLLVPPGVQVDLLWRQLMIILVVPGDLICNRRQLWCPNL